MDYLETDPDVDARKVALNGVSRYGKVVMWAGAQDTRFAMTFSPEAGARGLNWGWTPLRALRNMSYQSSIHPKRRSRCH
jgi:hypothetical protein